MNNDKLSTKVTDISALHITDSLINVTLIYTDGAYCARQCWHGTTEAKKFANDSAAYGVRKELKWDRPVHMVFCHVPEVNTTYQFRVQDGVVQW